jgi:glycosyltransferase involved in cell wall biosynthesis
MTPVLFDVSRLIIRASLAAPTGIDRVTEAYGRWLMSRTDVEFIPVCVWGGYIWPLRSEPIAAILQRKSSEPDFSAPNWQALLKALSGQSTSVEALRASEGPGLVSRSIRRYVPAAFRTFAFLRPRRIPEGAIYLNVSHYGLEQPKLLDRLVAKKIAPIALIHDLIPISHPEYCSPLASVWHRRRIDAVLTHAHHVIANSQNTAAELRAYASANGRRLPPISIAPLGLDSAFFQRKGALERAVPYFACVGTLEPRKNIAFLLALWQRLAQRMGDQTPLLVLVGQRGWENESIIDQLERAPAIRRFVHEISGVHDEQVAMLIAGACALLSLSFDEGFNLPVSEARAIGTPVIASDIPVHRELVPEATLIDPLDGPSWLAAIEKSAQIRTALESCTPFSWKDHFDIAAGAIGLGNKVSSEQPR